MMQQMENMAKSIAEINNNNNNQSASGGEESQCSVESAACECCQEKQPPTVSEDSAFDANEGTFVNVLDEMIITDELEQMMLSDPQINSDLSDYPCNGEAFSENDGHDENGDESDVDVLDN